MAMLSIIRLLGRGLALLQASHMRLFADEVAFVEAPDGSGLNGTGRMRGATCRSSIAFDADLPA